MLTAQKQSNAALVPSIRQSTLAIWNDLIQDLSRLLDGASVESLFAEFIDLYMRHLFPITPLIHEPSLRETASRICPTCTPLDKKSEDRVSSRTTLPSTISEPSSHGLEEHDRFEAQYLDRKPPTSIQLERSLNLLTALGAAVAALLPTKLSVSGARVAAILLNSSRQMLRTFEDLDVLEPCANSIIIRYLHVQAIHAFGQMRVSWYVFGEAVRLAQEMRLQDESSYLGLDPIEALLRRTAFWQLSTGDKSYAVLNAQPYNFHQWNFDKPFSVSEVAEDEDRFLDYSLLHNSPRLAACVIVGFNLISRIFARATDFLMSLRLLTDFVSTSGGNSELIRGQKAHLEESDFKFHKLLNNIPQWLQQPESFDFSAFGNEAVAAYAREYVWIQYTNIHLTFRALRLILVQKALDAGFVDLIGYSPEPALIAFHKLDLARDVLTMIRAVPFEAIKANGESMVEKIRQVGACLLELSQSVSTPAVASRATEDFQEILDVLASLDSRASDALAQRISS